MFSQTPLRGEEGSYGYAQFLYKQGVVEKRCVPNSADRVAAIWFIGIIRNRKKRIVRTGRRKEHETRFRKPRCALKNRTYNSLRFCATLPYATFRTFFSFISKTIPFGTITNICFICFLTPQRKFLSKSFMKKILFCVKLLLRFLPNFF